MLDPNIKKIKLKSFLFVYETCILLSTPFSIGGIERKKICTKNYLLDSYFNKKTYPKKPKILGPVFDKYLVVL